MPVLVALNGFRTLVTEWGFTRFGSIGSILQCPWLHSPTTISLREILYELILQASVLTSSILKGTSTSLKQFLKTGISDVQLCSNSSLDLDLFWDRNSIITDHESHETS
ncbi:uncharacterized protein ARMOST_18329 [Armillaria ostoyae]|uniref:Uncharacterized protein n=1 Tax=Armillaria ostoyae TaxID=47428 RepID=A0A284S1G6_ARMOS|nr:uncharacterized protein ARMOST_18329 [Armillaria ostoyae]